VTHDLSASSSRFGHMSPVAVALAALLHASAAFALLATPLREAEPSLDVLEVSLEQEPTPPPAPKPPDPPAQTVEPTPPPAPAPPPPAPPAPKAPPPGRAMLDSAPIGTTMDPLAARALPQVGAAEPETPSTAPIGKEPIQTQEAREEPKPEPPKEIVKVAPAQEEETVKPDPPQQQQLAALAPLPSPPPLPPAPPKLENMLPPVEAPPPPVTASEIPAVAPPPPPPPPKPMPQPARPPQAPPPPAPRAEVPQRQLVPSPLHAPTQPQQQAPGNSQQAARSAPSPFVNPADVYGQRKSHEDYRWSIERQIAQHRSYATNTRDSEEGTVVIAVTIARDGNLLNVGISRSSGSRNLDNMVLAVTRQAAPYPPLPNDLTGDRQTFVLQLNYRRTDLR
jgi:TonB family protein